jgi:hypothetical protein
MPEQFVPSHDVTAAAVVGPRGGTVLCRPAYVAWRQPMTRHGHVAGKSLFAISAGGMVATLSALGTGHVLEASAILLGTVVALEVMLRRAVARFHESGTPAYAPGFPGAGLELPSGR